MSRYAITLKEENLDLVQVLNGGVRPSLEEKPTVFLFDVKDGDTENPDIKFEDDLYDEKGHTDPDINWVF